MSDLAYVIINLILVVTCIVLYFKDYKRDKELESLKREQIEILLKVIKTVTEENNLLKKIIFSDGENEG